MNGVSGTCGNLGRDVVRTVNVSVEAELLSIIR